MRLLVFIWCWLTGHMVLGQKLPETVRLQTIPINEFANFAAVNDFLQDPHGLIWVACNGLQRYDGYHFTNVSRQTSDTTLNLSGREVTKLLWDKNENRLLATTRTNGLIAYSYATNKITKVGENQTGGFLREIVQDKAGVVWVTCVEKGVFKFKNNQFQLDQKLSQTISSPTAAIAFQDQVIFGDVNRIYFVRNESVVDTLWLKEISQELSVNTRVTSLMVDREANLWIGTEKNGVFVYHMPTRRSVKSFSPSNTPLFNRIEKIIQDKSGLIWIITKANGLVLYSPEENEYKHIRQPFFRSGMNALGACNSILEDSMGVIWIGSVGEVRKYDPWQLPFEHYLHNPEDPESLSDNMIRGISEDNHGNIWIGTEGGFLNRFDRKRGKVEQIRINVTGENEHITAYSIVEIQTNRYLINSNRGMIEFNYSTRQFKIYEPLRRISYGWPNRHMMMHRDTVWIVSYGRLIMHALKSKETKVYTDFQFPKNIRQSNNITCIGIDNDGRKWIGTNSGISSFNPKTERFRYFSLHSSNQSDSTSIMILAIQPHKRELWVSTFQKGLFVFDLNENGDARQKIHLDVKKGLPDNTVYGALPDDNGIVWLSTNQGMFSYHTTTGNIVSYGTPDGLQENEYNRLAFLKSRSGDFYFGGINGFNVFRPEKIKIPSLPFKPKILYTKMMSGVREEKITYFPEGKNLTIPRNSNSIEIKFFTPIYVNATHSRWQVKLSGVDTDWQSLVHSNTINYYNLKPGKYSFTVKNIDYQGRVSEASFDFKVDRPFWATWWFIVLSLLFLVGLFILFSTMRSKRIYLENKKLALLLSIKSKEILESKEELESLNHKKDLIFSILSHDLRSPLTTLKGFLGLLIDNNEMDRTEIKKHATNIRHSVTNALDLIDNTLYWSLSQMGNITYDPSVVRLELIFEKVKGLYTLTAEKKKIELNFQCQPDLELWADENMVYVAIRNLVSNALKFTTEGKKVTVIAEAVDRNAHITVKDEGIGMTEAERLRIINSDISFIKRGTSSEKGTGIGLSLCKKFIELNKGSLEIMSTENQGSVFIIVLPLSVNAPSDSNPVPIT